MKKKASAKKAKPKGKRKLKPPSKVERVWFSKDASGKIIRIGGYHYSDVYLGRMAIDGRKHRVAIKVFKQGQKLSNRKAKEYQRLINTLWKAGVMLPKMGMFKFPNGEWVQVSQLFGSTGKGSKIVNKSNLNIRSARGKAEAVEQIVKVANAGYTPIEDLVEPFRVGRKGSIPIDLDSIVNSRMEFGKRSAEVRASFVMEAVETVASSSSNAEYGRLCRIALKAANPGMRKALEKRIAK